MSQLFDMNKVSNFVKKQKALKKLKRTLTNVTYFSSSLFVLVGGISYGISRVVVTSLTNTTEFNQQYAKLRLLSFPTIILPLLIGFILIIWYLIHNLEKITEVDYDEFTITKL